MSMLKGIITLFFHNIYLDLQNQFSKEKEFCFLKQLVLKKDEKNIILEEYPEPSVRFLEATMLNCFNGKLRIEYYIWWSERHSLYALYDGYDAYVFGASKRF
ncbi:1712_t:CDS:2 [Dentiscutata erythropus]|uniref:1712_t:CDS:1 n=1 Tax=Dentiscutata erythropus TaxID=1348616 RepID=A0A9N9ECG0_9GLOM|nr:1712_t:CDS:2 [Dentiscutata erythropus]